MESYYNDEEGVVFEYSFGESDMKLLKQHSNTKRVSLYFGELAIPDLDFLAPCKSLEVVGIYGGKIGNYFALRQLPKLKTICFDEIEVPDLDFLAPCKSLEVVGIYGGKIGNYSALRQLPKLTNLGFEGLKVPDLDFLVPCKSLEDVSIYGGKIGNYSALRHLPKLKLLHLNGHLRRWLENFDFLTDLRSLKHLSIANYPMVTSFPSLPDLVNLESVSLWGCKRLTDILNVLSIPNLKIFSITSMPITVQDLECIAKKPGLEKMYGIFESKRKEEEFQSMLDQYGVMNGWKHS